MRAKFWTDLKESKVTELEVNRENIESSLQGWNLRNQSLRRDECSNSIRGGIKQHPYLFGNMTLSEVFKHTQGLEVLKLTVRSSIRIWMMRSLNISKLL
jgi:hypothetical protein